MPGAEHLTAIVLTLNEASRVGRCLRSLPLGARAVVIDSFSSDGTLEAARSAWAEDRRDPTLLALIQRTWPGFTEARRSSLKWAASEWVLWIDADEWVGKALARELETLSEPRFARVGLLRVPRLSVFLGREIRHGGWFPDRKARLGRPQAIEWHSGPQGSDVHEDLVLRADAQAAAGNAPWETAELPRAAHLGHEPFRDRAEQEATNDRYSSLLAKGLAAEWRRRGKRPYPAWWRALKVGVKFIENYVWKLGFLDGRPGLIIALGSARSMGLRLEKAAQIFHGPNELR
jgi:glycosyltransferase involved in cell wall biosynthesis